jgi:DNA polymerase I-like protein with 3'-5' exonuclease and polymerase domains
MFDMWVKLILKRRRQLTGQFHDEFILTLKIGNREKCEKLIRNAMKELNSMFNLNRELDCDVQFGSRYSEIH